MGGKLSENKCEEERRKVNQRSVDEGDDDDDET